jgi:uncharacterized protein YneF (UPF0154 family)
MNANSHPSRWKAICLISLVFVLGVVVGIGGGALVVRRTLQKQLAAGNVATPLIDHLERELTAKLGLTPSEQDAVRTELDVTRREIRDHRLHMLENLRTTSETTLARIKARLPEEKQATLEELARNRLGPWGLLIKK